MKTRQRYIGDRYKNPTNDYIILINNQYIISGSKEKIDHIFASCDGIVNFCIIYPPHKNAQTSVPSLIDSFRVVPDDYVQKRIQRADYRLASEQLTRSLIDSLKTELKFTRMEL